MSLWTYVFVNNTEAALILSIQSPVHCVCVCVLFLLLSLFIAVVMYCNFVSCTDTEVAMILVKTHLCTVSVYSVVTSMFYFLHIYTYT